MPTYVALLRGINVSGQKLIKMDALRASLEAAGLAEIRTYVQSGNAVFSAGKAPAAKLAGTIAARLLKDFGFSVPVIVRTAAELAQVARGNPLMKLNSIDPSKLHVTFLASAPARAAEDLLQRLAVPSERFQVLGQEVYLHCPDGYGRTRLSNTALEKALGVGATTRNWNTVQKLLAMAAGRGE